MAPPRTRVYRSAVSADDLLLRPARLAALRSVAILDTPREADFDDLCALAAELCEVPYALVNFLDAERQWFKSEIGLGGAAPPPVKVSLCRHAMLVGDYVEYRDLCEESGLAEHPLVIRPPHFRFYAGAMLKVDGENVGSLCVLDTKPRALSEGQARGLRTLAAQVMKLLDLRRKLRWQKEAGEAKDDFLAKLSHELRTPLTPVLMTVSALLEEGIEPEPLREQLTMILRNVQTEARLIDDLLDVTRIAHGKLLLKTEPADLHALVRQAVAICTSQLTERGLVPRLALRAERHWVQGDPARLGQVFWNLLSNAAKFAPAGGEIEVSSEDIGDCVRVTVRDQGRGIDPSLLPSIFEAFDQGDRETTRTHGGLGLGLAICKGVTELHGGTLRAESNGLGCGACFSLELVSTDARPATAATATVDSAARPLSILLVEDHGSTGEVLARLMARSGHRVQAAGTLAEARTLAGGHAFDVLVSDLGLPDGSGLDLMRELGPRQGLTGIALSGYGTPADLVASQEAGFILHLLKPVAWKVLEAALREVPPRVAEAG